MKKSPARWIKRVLFGRKTPKSRSLRKPKTQKAARDDFYVDGQGTSAQEGPSPIISPPLRVTSSISFNANGEKKTSHSLQTSTALVLDGNAHQQDNETAHTPNPKHVNRHTEARDSEVRSEQGRGREKQAAIKIQALFKGHRARKAIRALQRIITLQSFVRGQLVRRQALMTLLCINGVIKLQAVVRGQQVRMLRPAVQVPKAAAKDIMYPDSSTATKLLQKKKLSTYNFVCSLIPSVPVAKPLQIQYEEGDSNSVKIWLERWNTSHVWKSTSKGKQIIVSKSNARHGSPSRNAGSALPKRNNRKVSPAKTNPRSKTTSPLPDRRKQQVQKGANSPANKARGRPRSEQAKVSKRSSKKSTSPSGIADRSEITAETMMPFSLTSSGQPHQSDSEMETPMLTSGSNALALEHTDDPAEKTLAVLSPECRLEQPPGDSSLHSTQGEYHVETIRKPHVDILILHENCQLPAEANSEQVSDLNDGGHDDAMVEANPSIENLEKRHLPRNKWMLSNGKQHPQEILAAIKTASNQIEDSGISAKTYRTSAAQTKARLHGQRSPKVSPALVNKNDPTQQHSPKPSRDGKLGHRVGQPVAKKGPKSDKGLSSARDKNDKSIQPGWRR